MAEYSTLIAAFRATFRNGRRKINPYRKPLSTIVSVPGFEPGLLRPKRRVLPDYTIH